MKKILLSLLLLLPVVQFQRVSAADSSIRSMVIVGLAIVAMISEPGAHPLAIPLAYMPVKEEHLDQGIKDLVAKAKADHDAEAK